LIGVGGLLLRTEPSNDDWLFLKIFFLLPLSGTTLENFLDVYGDWLWLSPS
jgi:hypothetical protein